MNIDTKFHSTEDWTFADANVRMYTHGLHPYPARMCPQIAERIIQRSKRKKPYVYDPFCGSGTVLVEATRFGCSCVGVDLNPFALLLANVKTLYFDPSTLQNEIINIKNKIKEKIVQLRFENANLNVPNFFNIDYWFKPNVIKELTLIRDEIFNVDDENIRDFFKVCFSMTVRKSSNTKNGEFKLFRLKEEQLKRHNPNVIGIFFDIVDEYKKLVLDYSKMKPKDVEVRLILSDTRNVPIEDEAFDLLITSPPYGDSKTTVAYGQFSRFALQWLGYEDNIARSIDHKSLGGFMSKRHRVSFHSDALDKTLECIGEIDKKRANDVERFNEDLFLAYEEMYRVMKNESYTFIVVGNRTVKNTIIPTHAITKEMCEEIGFKFGKFIPRNIPYKTMPQYNSPTNVPGVISKTMSKENIVVLTK